LLLVEKLLEKKEPIKPDDVISEDNWNYIFPLKNKFNLNNGWI
jgi:hypothetical protein